MAVRILLEAGINPNVVNDNGETILHRCQNINVAQLLLEEVKVVSNQKTRRDGHTPLLSWLSRGNAVHALQLLEFGADARDVDKDGNGTFHHAVGIKDFGDVGKRLIESLLAAGADLNLRNRKSQTPLHVLGNKNSSSNKFDHKAFTALVAAGADPEVRDNQGQTLLFQKVGSRNLPAGERIDLCEKMVKAGASIDTVDSSGRNLLHSCISNYPNNLELFRFLIGHGVDPKQTDNEGNTLCHKAASFYVKMSGGKTMDSLFEELIRLGVHLDQPNNSGRTPLHLLSSILPGGLENRRAVAAGGATAFDYVLELQHNVDCEDMKGITALHLASTFSKYQTGRLLQAGARPSKATYEGLSSLHLAARPWQPNILGMLLESLRSQNSRDKFSATTDAEEGHGRTALYYACTSGRAESVKLLIGAGASVDAEYYYGSAWNGCVAFENEVSNWELNNIQHSGDRSCPDSGGVMIGDKTRPQLFQQGSYSTARLDEILEVLASHEPQKEFIESAIADSGRRGLEYTVACLWRTRCNLGIEDEYDFDLSTYATLRRRQANRKAFEKISLKLPTPPPPLKSEFRQLMYMREYDLLGELLLKKNCMEFDEDGDMIINHLISGGFASIIKRVVTQEVARKLEEWGWCEQQAASSKISNPYIKPENIQPLLWAACKRELPNMDVIRVLVEDVGST